LRSFVAVNMTLQAKFRCSFIRFVRLASIVSLARTSPYKKNPHKTKRKCDQNNQNIEMLQ